MAEIMTDDMEEIMTIGDNEMITEKSIRDPEAGIEEGRHPLDCLLYTSNFFL